jgi:hypothetical protein
MAQAYAYDEKTRTDRPPSTPPGKAELSAAYEKGRQDEARRKPKRRRGHPLFSFLILLVVAAAAALFYLAAQNGSFAGGGAVVDKDLATAQQKAQAPFRRAADRAGDTLENAGQTLKQKAGDQPSSGGSDSGA